MALTKVLITVKTYPSLSKKYDELVCTAGFREDGSWIRIYPIQFRKKSYDEQYRKYQWIEIDLEKNTSDFRPESYRPHSHETTIKILGDIPPDKDSWHDRRKIVLTNVYSDITQLIKDAKNKNICCSLAVFKPTQIIDFKYEETTRNWSQDKLEILKQLNLFEKTTSTEAHIVKKLPYKFSFKFRDSIGVLCSLMIEDWETGQLFWNCLKRNNGNEIKACEDVKKKYFDDFAKTKDLYLFLGTTKIHHFRAPNPFIIIGTFHPKHETQLKLF
jgi:hypothetical protein